MFFLKNKEQCSKYITLLSAGGLYATEKHSQILDFLMGMSTPFRRKAMGRIRHFDACKFGSYHIRAHDSYAYMKDDLFYIYPIWVIRLNILILDI